MRKVLILLTLGILIFGMVPFKAEASRIDLEYTMIVENPESHKAKIKINFFNLNMKNLKLTMPIVIGEYFEVPISNFNAIDSQGKKLDFSL
ncbi:MAG: hypothetical protein ACE5HW_04450, partial [Candidatus Methanofastidiosia archaeon]